VGDYKGMLAMYEDFQQKKSFRTMAKMQADRQQLPIASFRDTIVEAVRDNPVVVLAGASLTLSFLVSLT
jgi:HrpA-like RNA helicase